MPQKLHLHSSNIISTGTSNAIVAPPTAKIPEATVIVKRRKLLFPLSRSPNADFDRNRKSDVTGDTPLRRSPVSALRDASSKTCNALISSPGQPESRKRSLRKREEQRKSSRKGRNKIVPADPIGTPTIIVNAISKLRLSSSNSPTSIDSPKLGRGGFGNVYVGFGADGKRYAFKDLNTGKRYDISLIAELNLFKLQKPHFCHPNIVRLIEYDCYGECTQLMFEYVGQYNLQQFLDAQDFPVSSELKVKFCRQIADALNYCHREGILHLDVKPANVLLTAAIDCKLADFGCSVCLPVGETSVAAPSYCTGTLIYRAPELLRGLAATAKCDVYSYAYVIWECLTNEWPFFGRESHSVVFCVVAQNLRPSVNPGQIRGRIEAKLWELCQRCWAPLGQNRPDFSEILKILSKF